MLSSGDRSQPNIFPPSSASNNAVRNLEDKAARSALSKKIFAETVAKHLKIPTNSFSEASNSHNAQTAQAPCFRSQQKQQEINRKEINHQKEEQQQKRAANTVSNSDNIRTIDFDADDEADFLSFPKYYESHPADRYPTEELSDIEQISAQERNIQLKEKFVPIPVGIYFKKFCSNYISVLPLGTALSNCPYHANAWRPCIFFRNSTGL